MILDHAYMTLTYLDAIILFLSGWLRKEGIAINSARKKLKGLLMMMTTSCMTCLQPLKTLTAKPR
jgi:hypothetical protein